VPFCDLLYVFEKETEVPHWELVLHGIALPVDSLVAEPCFGRMMSHVLMTMQFQRWNVKVVGRTAAQHQSG
jgi:hypothetical protein